MNDRLTDPLDFAQQLEYTSTTDAINTYRSLVPTGRPDLEDEIECACGSLVEPRRARLGYDTCFECANWAEKRNKTFKRERDRDYV